LLEDKVPKLPLPVRDLVELRDNRLHLNLHKGQMKAWLSRKRMVTVLSGSQGGKTSSAPPWLLREIQRRGPGDYMVVTPTFPLLELKALPTFRRLFERQLGLGIYQGHPLRKFTFSEAGSRYLFGDRWNGDDTIVFFGHANDPESLESATAKAAWLDEAGQSKVRVGSWEAILRRLSVHEGRVLITTTPYILNWLKTKLWDPWKAADEDHPTIDIIRFDSIENPSFPIREFERARRDLPAWKFNMFYRAMFTRPAGQIYDCFDEDTMKIPRREINPHWRRYLGLDFGGVNTAGVFFAEDPEDKRLYAYREYHAGGRTAQQHVQALLAGEPCVPFAVGGAKSEQQWRDEFRAAGLPVAEPDIVESTATQGRNSGPREVGINRVYAAFQRDQIRIFDDLVRTLDDILTYSRKLDESGNPTEEVDDPHSFHAADCVRYVLAHIRKTDMPFVIGLPPEGKGSVIKRAPQGGQGRACDQVKTSERV
jgi:hypothetical protein